MKFKSRKDVFFTVVVYALLLFMLITTSISVSDKNRSTETIVTGLVTLLTCIFILWLFHGTYYVISKKTLYYYSGPFRGKVPIEKITSIRKGKTMWVGLKPATAKNGLIIKYEKYNDIYISPLTNELFIKEILKVNPSISIKE